MTKLSLVNYAVVVTAGDIRPSPRGRATGVPSWRTAAQATEETEILKKHRPWACQNFLSTRLGSGLVSFDFRPGLQIISRISS